MILFKILQMFLLPSVFLLILAIAGIFLLLKTKKRKIGKLVLISSIVFYYCFSITPIADLILKPLEGQYSQIKAGQLSQAETVVLLLGGRESDVLRESEVLRIYFLKEKEAEIIISGRDPINENVKDGEKVKSFLIERGVGKEDIILENKSRTTFESAKNIEKVLNKKTFFLITSAYHMPRAMEVFLKKGTSPIPCPADFKIEDNYDIFDFFPAPKNLKKCNLVFHEYFGILYYKIK